MGRLSTHRSPCNRRSAQRLSSLSPDLSEKKGPEPGSALLLLNRIGAVPLLVILLGCLCGCQNWQSYHWSSRELRIQRVAAGEVILKGLSSRFLDAQSLDSMLGLSIRGAGVDLARPTPGSSKGVAESGSYRSRKETLELNSVLRARYLLRGEMDVRAEETLVQRQYSLSLFFQILDLRTGAIVREATVMHGGLTNVSRPRVYDGLKRILRLLLPNASLAN